MNYSMQLFELQSATILITVHNCMDYSVQLYELWSVSRPPQLTTMDKILNYCPAFQPPTLEELSSSVMTADERMSL